ncbi:MAG: hypothetical protein WB502_01060 [Thermoactinomyces sp.]
MGKMNLVVPRDYWPGEEGNSQKSCGIEDESEREPPQEPPVPNGYI